MSLPKPTPEQLLEVIDGLVVRLRERGDNIQYCRNCYETRSNNMFSCERCNLWRCDKCRPIHIAMRDNLIAYLCLELEVFYPVLESLIHACHTDVLICDSCSSTRCTRCSFMIRQEEVYHSGAYGEEERIYVYYNCDECI